MPFPNVLFLAPESRKTDLSIFTLVIVRIPSNAPFGDSVSDWQPSCDRENQPSTTEELDYDVAPVEYHRSYVMSSQLIGLTARR